MDFPLFAAARRRRNLFLLLAAAGITSYGAYRLYHHPSVATRRRKLVNFVRILAAVADAASSAADTVSLVSSDLSRFLRSESDTIPSSLRQISKLAGSGEFTTVVSTVSEAVTVGVLRGVKNDGEAPRAGISDKFLDRLFSAEGSGFVSVAGNFAKGLAMGYYRPSGGEFEVVRADGGVSGIRESDWPHLPGWMQLICSDKGRQLAGEYIRVFVSTAVTAYLEKTMNVNTYDQMFAGMTNPRHEAKAKELLVSVCNGVMDTLVRTSHQVLTTSKASSSNSSGSSLEEVELHRDASASDSSKDCDGWIRKVSATIAVPSNQRFLLDVTGKVTTNTVRTFLDFMSWKMRDSANKGASVVRQEVVERGLEVARYISAKSILVLAICFSFCMHLLPGTRLLIPA